MKNKSVQGRIAIDGNFPYLIYLENGEVVTAVLSFSTLNTPISIKDQILANREKFDGAVIIANLVQGKSEGWIMTELVSVPMDQTSDLPMTAPRAKSNVDYNQVVKLEIVADNQGNLYLEGTFRNNEKRIIAEKKERNPISFFVLSLFNPESFLYLGNYPIIKSLQDWIEPVAEAATVCENVLMRGMLKTNWKEQITLSMRKATEHQQPQQSVPSSATLPPRKNREEATTTSGLPPRRKAIETPQVQVPEFTTKAKFNGTKAEWKQYKLAHPHYDFDKKELKKTATV